jgi:hypothetical protein
MFLTPDNTVSPSKATGKAGSTRLDDMSCYRQKKKEN